MRAKTMDNKTDTVERASFDLDAYCRRIGFAGVREPTLETLRALHLLHPQAIPFENLDPLLKRPVALDVESLQRKMVRGGRGGYCFEQNTLFGQALNAMGFKFKELAARVLWNRPAGTVGPRGHMLLLVDIDGQGYVADVGFGGNTMTAPLALLAGVAQATPHESFRLMEADGDYIVQIDLRGAWVDVYGFDLVEQLPPDIDQGNWYMATHPKSPFTTALVAGRVVADRRYGLHDNQLATHRLNGRSERRVLHTESELRDVLTGLFGLTLPEDPGLDAALTRMTMGTSR
jgi:N-hydroxyarylamine O-acetyltransferase